MKILYLTIAFHKAEGNLYNDLVESFLSRGHNVTIVCSQPGINENYLEIINDNYKILNIKTADPFNSNFIKKGINMLRLEPVFKKAIKENLSNESFDLILYATPPISLNGAVTFCKNKYRAKSYLMLKDIFPQNAVDLNLINKNGLIYKFFRRKEKKLYSISDAIGCMSEGNISYFKKHNTEIDIKKINLFPNSIQIRKPETTRSWTDTKPLTVIYGGNLGKPQNISGLIKIAKALSDENIKFLFIGKGMDQNLIKEAVSMNPNGNIEFEEFLATEEYEKKLEEADLGLISLDPRFTIPNMPSKLQSYMHLCLPILALTDRNTDVKNIIKKSDCGWWNYSEDIEGIYNQIKYINEHREELPIKGCNGYHYLIENYDVNKNVDTLESFMKGVEK